jgi:hypothetical protein
MRFTMSLDSLARSMRAVSLACSDDFTRPHLNSLRFGFDDDSPSLDSFTFVATDGHVLFKHDVRPGEIDDVDVELGTAGKDLKGKETWTDAPRFALLALPNVTALLRMIGKKPQGGVTCTVTAATVAFSFAGVNVSYPNVSEGASFPPYKQVMPAPWSRTPLGDVGHIGASASYLATVGKALAALDPGARSDGLVFDFGDSLDPIRITSGAYGAEGFTAIVMPMRVTAPERKLASKAELKEVNAAHNAAIDLLRKGHAFSMAERATANAGLIERDKRVSEENRKLTDEVTRLRTMLADRTLSVIKGAVSCNDADGKGTTETEQAAE